MPFSDVKLDPETLRRLTRAFEMAWDYLETKPHKVDISRDTAREDLALLMMNLVRSGERNPIRIANIAIDQLRERNASIFPSNPKTARRMKITSSSVTGPPWNTFHRGDADFS